MGSPPLPLCLGESPVKHFPGEVFFLPPDELEGGDQKWRRHLLVTETGVDDTCTVAYASTSALEAQYGAAYCLVDPAKTSYRETGFTDATYVYPSRLVSLPSADLREAVGRLLEHMADVKARLVQALGLDTGTAREGKARGSVRGQIAVLKPEAAGLLDTRHVIVVTEPAYSLKHRHQIVVPVYKADDFIPAPGDVEVAGVDWLGSIGIERAVLATGFVQSFFQPEHIAGVTGGIVDSETIAELDDALTDRFGL